VWDCLPPPRASLVVELAKHALLSGACVAAIRERSEPRDHRGDERPEYVWNEAEDV
jgi:hypothetical protein